MLGLFCHVQIGVFMEAYLDEVDMGRIALSCHFSLDLRCDKNVFIAVGEWTGICANVSRFFFLEMIC